MNETMKRLYEFLKTNHKLEGQSAVAARLNMSPQTLNNWEGRGISKNGALQAQTIFGCNAHWIISGVGPKMATEGLNEKETELLRIFRKIESDKAQEHALRVLETFAAHSFRR
ncbi:hypothetical protein [Ferrovum sp.]|uniref:hypothetical protein n=1 Tax=Ferrovum sp. TaxID=2609467 RepID=UPI00261F3C99|nr:hypothetical protein [Ferrovum sp.]